MIANMIELHFPWLELAIVAPLLGGIATAVARNPEDAWRRGLASCGATLLFTLGAWQDFRSLHVFEATDRMPLAEVLFGQDVIVIDELSAPLLPLAALLYFLVTLTTLRTKARRFPFAWTQLSLALLVALLSCRAPWGIIALLAAQTIPPWFELRARRRSTRPFTFHMLLFVALLITGWGMIDAQGGGSQISIAGVALLIAAVLVRSGVAPLHCWMTDLFENATLGTALLFVTPMSGAYAAVRLVLPVAPTWALESIALLSLATAIYAAGMALVQREARRFFCYLFLSHTSLVLVGLEVATAVGLTGALCVWLSVGMSLAGLGLTLRALESRVGRLSLADFHGLYEHMPKLGVFFLLTGLASIGFPGTIGFIGTELLVEGAVDAGPLVATLVVVAAALNGIAILKAYFRLFTGTRHVTAVPLDARWHERLAVLVLSALILAGGIFPQPGIASRYDAATELLKRRTLSAAEPSAAPASVVAHDSPSR